VEVPSSGENAGKAAAILRTSVIGGDNHKLVALAAREHRFVCKQPVVGATLTVWRKLWLRIDQMHDATTGHTDVTNHSPYVKASLDDGFYEIEYDVTEGWNRREHKEILEPEDTWKLCEYESQDSNEPFPPPEYSHAYIDYHTGDDSNPSTWGSPPHTMNLVGSHKIRWCRGDNTWKSVFYGVYCPIYGGIFGIYDSHSWTAENCMRGAYGLEPEGDPPKPENHPCYLKPQERWDLDGDGDKDGRDAFILQWRAAVHEIGHNIGHYLLSNSDFDDICHPSQPLCGEPSSCSDTSSACDHDTIMEYDCMYSAAFGGYFNEEQIMDLRKGALGIRQ
jgi:hypothetical protein